MRLHFPIQQKTSDFKENKSIFLLIPQLTQLFDGLGSRIVLAHLLTEVLLRGQAVVPLCQCSSPLSRHAVTSFAVILPVCRLLGQALALGGRYRSATARWN